MTVTVVKVGGSLSRGGSLPRVCAGLAVAGRASPLLVVPGGGPSADVVREQDERFALRASTAHWMAILAMDQFGLLLADLIPGAETVRTLEEARERAADHVVVLLPADLLRSADPLPHDWSVTSDAIAAWVTERLGGRLLVLLKDHHGMAALAPPAGGALTGAPAPSRPAGPSGVDAHLSARLDEADFDLWAIDGEHERRLIELLETGDTEGVRLARRAP